MSQISEQSVHRAGELSVKGRVDLQEMEQAPGQAVVYFPSTKLSDQAMFSPRKCMYYRIYFSCNLFWEMLLQYHHVSFYGILR